MSTSESISHLFNLGVHEITVGRAPTLVNGPPRFFIKVQQFIPTGEEGNNTMAIHQTVGESISKCLSHITPAVTETHQRRQEPNSLIVMPSGERN